MVRTRGIAVVPIPYHRVQNMNSRLRGPRAPIRLLGLARRVSDTKGARSKETSMGISDKVSGRTKKAVADLAGDSALYREGAREERKGEAKQELRRTHAEAERKADE